MTTFKKGDIVYWSDDPRHSSRYELIMRYGNRFERGWKIKHIGQPDNYYFSQIRLEDMDYWTLDPIAMKQKTFKQELNLILKESTDE